MRDFFRRQTTYKKILRIHGVPNFVVSKLLGYSYAYTSHLLSGNVKMPASAAEKLEKFCRKLEARESKRPE
jgi:hypothetical protein